MCPTCLTFQESPILVLGPPASSLGQSYTFPPRENKGYVVWFWTACVARLLQFFGPDKRLQMTISLLSALGGSSDAPLLGHSAVNSVRGTACLLPFTSFPSVHDQWVSSRKCPWTGLPIALVRALSALWTHLGYQEHTSSNPQQETVHLLPWKQLVFTLPQSGSQPVYPALRSSGWQSDPSQFWVSQNAGDRFQSLGVILLKPPLSRLNIKVEN